MKFVRGNFFRSVPLFPFSVPGHSHILQWNVFFQRKSVKLQPIFSAKQSLVALNGYMSNLSKWVTIIVETIIDSLVINLNMFCGLLHVTIHLIVYRSTVSNIQLKDRQNRSLIALQCLTYKLFNSYFARILPTI